MENSELLNMARIAASLTGSFVPPRIEVGQKKSNQIRKAKKLKEYSEDWRKKLFEVDTKKIDFMYMATKATYWLLFTSLVVVISFMIMIPFIANWIFADKTIIIAMIASTEIGDVSALVAIVFKLFQTTSETKKYHQRAILQENIKHK